MRDDKYFLRKAIEVGNRNAKPYNFGAVVVKDGKIIAAEESKVQALNDPSAHDAICAFRVAAEKLENYHLDGCTLYTSHEPCIMCFACAFWANVERIVYVTPKEDQKEIMYESDELHLQDLAKKLARPMKVEQIRVE